MKKQIRSGTFSYHALFRPEPDGGFTVIVPSLPGCVTFGRTLEEAQTMITDAITGYLASLRKHGELIPTDEGAFFTTVAPKLKYNREYA